MNEASKLKLAFDDSLLLVQNVADGLYAIIEMMNHARDSETLRLSQLLASIHLTLEEGLKQTEKVLGKNEN